MLRVELGGLYHLVQGVAQDVEPVVAARVSFLLGLVLLSVLSTLRSLADGEIMEGGGVSLLISIVMYTITTRLLMLLSAYTNIPSKYNTL